MAGSTQELRTRIIELLSPEPLSFVELCLAFWPAGAPAPAEYEAFVGEMRALVAEGLVREEPTTSFFLPAVLVYGG